MTTDLQPIMARDIARVSRPEAFEHRAHEIGAWLELVRPLDADEWHRPTVCAEWDVADIVGHLVGQADEVRRPWAFPRRELRARRRYPGVEQFDRHMMVQADEYRGTPPAELTARFERRWHKASRTILRLPRPVRAMRLTIDDIPDPTFKRVALGYVHDVLLSRDLWMHRDDVCQALGRPFDAGPHATELIAQVMLDLQLTGYWSGPAVVVELTGPGAGRYQLGSGDPVGTASVDAVSYMRTVSGRDDHPVVTGDAAAASAVSAARMPF
jgi:uncharacterized protein (TIGR03083 family)